MTRPYAVIFDVDGTLVDSQNLIVRTMSQAFAACGLPAPDADAVRRIIGRSLEEAVHDLAPGADAVAIARAYRAQYHAARSGLGSGATSPLFDGIAAVLQALSQRAPCLLAVATGKSRRGLATLIDDHGWQGLFLSQHCADDHPSKPHPSMITAVLDDLGVAPDRAVMVGDTCYDMQMAHAAKVRALGVAWGYHPADALGADRLAQRPADLIPAIDSLLEI